MKTSPIKSIILPFVVKKKLKKYNKHWDDNGEQLIHVEPMNNGRICAVTMKVLKRKGRKCTLLLDIKLDKEKHNLKIDRKKTKLIEASGKIYDFELHLVVKKKTGNEDSHYKLPGTCKLKKNKLIDLKFHPPRANTKLKSRIAIQRENKATSSNRICKIRVF